jgi:hypothetical protein
MPPDTPDAVMAQTGTKKKKKKKRKFLNMAMVRNFEVMMGQT